MSNDDTHSDDAIRYDRSELTRNLQNWLDQQDYSEDEMSEVLQRIQQFDERTLRDAFFSSVGTGNVELKAFVQDILNTPSRADPQDAAAAEREAARHEELAEVSERWNQLSEETRWLIHRLATDEPTPITIKGIEALLGAP